MLSFTTALCLVTVASAFVSPGSTTVKTRPAFVRAASATSSRVQQSTQLFASSSFKKIFVAGGSKGVGRQVVNQILAKQDGTTVVALVRDKAVADELNALSTDEAPVKAIVGDAYDQKTVENAMDGCDAAITTLGGGTTLPDGSTQRIDYAGNSNVIESAGILGVTRVILVTTVGCGDSKEATPEQTYETLREVIEAKNKAENLLIKYYTNTNWTIIRPGGLISEPMTNKAVLTSDHTVLGLIHREDVARLVLEALDSANTERQILSALDPSIESSYKSEKPIEAFALA